MPAFGGCDDHGALVFETERGEYGRPDPELGHRNAATVTLKAVAPRAGARLRYLYDFGDDWEHDLVVEAVGRADPDASYPRCTGGRRAGPPEDCGGIWGYGDLLEILACPAPDHGALRPGTPDDPDASALTCTVCDRRYPVADGIPVLLLSEASGGPAPAAQG